MIMFRMSLISCLSLAVLAAATDPSTVSISIGSHTDVNATKISPYLASMSIVYSWAADEAGYSNGSIANWAKTHKIKTARYPAGMASYWNWENPSGQMGNSTLDPNWKGTPSPPADWMSLSEYLDLCAASSMTPLIGVNYNCKNKLWVNENESIARAVRQVQFVINKGFKGGMWYIGNEDESAKPTNTARLRAHALAMKEIDPTMKIFFNDNGLNANSLEKVLKIADKSVDGGEFHGKWPQGGMAGHAHSYEDWLTEVPLIEHKSGQTWREKISVLRATTKQLGRPDFLLANNEFGLGKEESMVGFNRFTKSLVVTEFAMEMYIAGYDVAAFWDNGGTNSDDHMLQSNINAFRFNPMHFGIEMLARAANETMIPMTTSANRVHGFAAYISSTGAVVCYLINKYESEMNVTFSLHGETSDPRAESLVDTVDHWGMVQNTSVTCNGLNCKAVLPSTSFTTFTF